MREIAQSHSKIQTYDECPNKYKLIYVEKSYASDTDNPYFIKGQKLHKQLEDYVVSKLANDPSLVLKMSIASRNAVPIIDKLIKRYKDYYPESKICVDKEFKKLSWFNKAAYYRAIVDFLAKDNNHAILLDYKSGKVRPYDGWGGQLHLSAWLIMELFPKIQKVTSAYLYLEHKHTVSITLNREDLPALRTHFQDKYTEINSDEEFLPKRNPHCMYCNATPKQCKFKRIKEL